jgi:hypothetical protein
MQWNRSQILRNAHAAAAMVALALAACGDDDNTGPDPGETELITRVTIALTPAAGGATQTAVINDPDGNGPTAPSAPSLTFALAPGATYNGAIALENASDPSNIVDITEEVEAEKEAHRFFYTPAGLTGVTIPDASLDQDANNAPVGLTFQVVVEPGAATGQNGTIRVVLSHYDVEPKGDGSTPSDETDVDVTFAASVQ